MTVEPFGDDDPEDGWNELDSVPQQLLTIQHIVSLLGTNPPDVGPHAERVAAFVAFVIQRVLNRDLDEREPQ